MEKDQETKFKVGDKVICINNKGVRLTCGMMYIVKATFTESYGKFLQVKNDINVNNNVYSKRFIPCLPAMESLYS